MSTALLTFIFSKLLGLRCFSVRHLTSLNAPWLSWVLCSSLQQSKVLPKQIQKYKAQKCLILPEEIGKDELSLVPESFLRIQELWADVLDNVAVVKWQEEWSTCIKWVPKKKYPIIQIQVTVICAHLMESKHYSVFMIQDLQQRRTSDVTS